MQNLLPHCLSVSVTLKCLTHAPARNQQTESVCVSGCVCGQALTLRDTFMNELGDVGHGETMGAVRHPAMRTTFGNGDLRSILHRYFCIPKCVRSCAKRCPPTGEWSWRSFPLVHSHTSTHTHTHTHTHTQHTYNRAAACRVCKIHLIRGITVITFNWFYIFEPPVCLQTWRHTKCTATARTRRTQCVHKREWRGKHRSCCFQLLWSWAEAIQYNQPAGCASLANLPSPRS